MEALETIKALLSKAEEQLKLQREHQQKTGEAFNIFTVLDRERKEESTHCRLLYELLNPEGSHGCGDAFLRKFFEDVLDKPYEEATGVYREENTGDGRIDLVIEGRNHYYPLEVKIDASDQDRQIERYITFAKKKNRKVTQIYYLTLDGHKPSSESLGGFPGEQVNCISFRLEVRNWIESCEKIAERKSNISVILQQYRKLINKLTGQSEEDSHMKEIIEIIGKSQENYESAIAISQALVEAQIEKGKAVCHLLVEHIQKAGLRYKPNDPIPLFDEGIEHWYRWKKCTWPSIFIPIGDDSLVEICLEFGKADFPNQNHLIITYGVQGIMSNDEISLEKLFERFPSNEWKSLIQNLTVEKIKKRWLWLWYKVVVVDDEIFTLDNEKLFGRFDEVIKKLTTEIDRQIEHIQRTGLPID